MVTALRQFLTRLGTLAAHPIAFVLLVVYGIAWAIFSPETLEWHAYATLVTLFIALLIQRAEHRDTQALHAKLDELLRTQVEARSSMTHIDEQEPEDIVAQRKAERRTD